MWLLDEARLQVLKKLPIASAGRVVSAPALSFAYAVEKQFGPGTLIVIDLKSGMRVQQYSTNDFGGKLIGFDFPVVTPDGRYLFAVGFEQICRFRLREDQVLFDEVSPRLLQGAFGGLCVSNDGKWVCGPSGGGNYGLPDVPSGSSYSTYLYSTVSFRKPMLVLAQGAYPRAVGFDMPSGLIYTQNHDKDLLIFDSKGRKLKEYAFAGRGRDPRQFLVHPEGRKMLVLSGENTPTLRVVELPVP
jgi:hypothetical protein